MVPGDPLTSGEIRSSDPGRPNEDILSAPHLSPASERMLHSTLRFLHKTCRMSTVSVAHYIDEARVMSLFIILKNLLIDISTWCFYMEHKQILKSPQLQACADDVTKVPLSRMTKDCAEFCPFSKRNQDILQSLAVTRQWGEMQFNLRVN